MSKREEGQRPAEWELHLKQALDQLSDLGDEAPPNLAALQMLVADVQAEQRRQLYRDLLKFWAVAVVVLAGFGVAMLRLPALFLALQAVIAVLSLAGVGFWLAGRKRVAE